MLLVLCLGLMLNSILMSNQVFHNNFKAGNPMKVTRKVSSQIYFNQKLRNARKVLRKAKQNQLKMDVDNWGYEDVSEPLQYNYHDIWWTNNIPSTTTKATTTRTTTLSTVNVYHRTDDSIHTNPTISTDNLYPSTDTIETEATNSSKITFDNNNNDTNITLTETTSDSYIKTSKATEETILPKSDVRNRITTPEKPVSDFVDQRKGIYVPVFAKDVNGQFSIVANESDLFVKRNDNDTNMHASIKKNIFIGDELDVGMFDFIEVRDPKKKTTEFIKVVYADNVAEGLKQESQGANIIIHPKQSKVLPSIVKDGIYRIELPDPVLKKKTTTSVAPQFKSNGNQNQLVPRFMQPSQQMIDEALAYYNVNSSQVPFLKENSGASGPNNLAQNGPGYFYPQNNLNYRQRPFYNPYNVGQNGQAPYYNLQYPGNYRQRPNYGPYGPAPAKNQQNPGYGPMQFMSNHLGPPQRPFYSANQAQNPFNSQNLGNGNTFNSIKILASTQKPSDNNEGPKQTRNVEEREFYINQPERGRQGHTTTLADKISPNKILEMLQNEKDMFMGKANEADPGEIADLPKGDGKSESVEAAPPFPMNTPAVTFESRSTFEEGYGPRKRTAPPFIDEIGPISPYVKQLLQEKKDLNFGFYSMFLIRLFEIVSKKEHGALKKFLEQAQFESVILFDQEHFLDEFGQPFGKSFQFLANLVGVMPLDAVQSAAVLLHHTMVNRREGVTMDINSVIDYIDSLYETSEGVELFRLLEDIQNYDKAEINVYELYRKMSRVVFAPVRRLSGTSKRQVLIESLNRVIDNHSKVVIPEDDNIQNMRRHMYTLIFKQSSTSMQKNIVDNSKIKIYNINDKRDAQIKFTKRLLVPTPRSNLKRVVGPRFPKESVFKYVHSKQKENNQRTKDNVLRAQNNANITVFKLGNSNGWKKSNKFRLQYNAKREQNSNKNFIKVPTIIEKPTSKNNNQKESSNSMSDESNDESYYKQSHSTTTTKSMKKGIFQSNSEKYEKVVRGKLKNIENIIADKILKEHANNNKLKKIKVIKKKAPDSIIKSVQSKVLEDKNHTFMNESDSSTEEKYDDYYEEDTTKTETLTVQKIKTTEATTTPKHSEEHHNSKKLELHTYSEENRKQKEPERFSKKEERHLRHKHPKIYKKYLRHMKKLKHKMKHKKNLHEQRKKKSKHSEKKIRYYKKKSRNFKKKTNKKIKKLKKIEHQYKHIIKHHMVRKNLKAIKNNINKDISEERIENNEESPYFYTPFKSVENGNTDKTKPHVETHKPETSTTNLMATTRDLFVTSTNKAIPQKHINIFSTTEKWIQLPIQETYHDSLEQSFRTQNRANKSNSNSEEYFKPSLNKKNIMESSSYSDQEDDLKDHLYDAMRHDNLRVLPQRRTFHKVPVKKDKLRTFSSYSSEEVVLKSNIYKAVGFNNSRVNFSEIVKKGSNAKKKTMEFRSRFKPVNEMTSYSDEENTLKSKLYASEIKPIKSDVSV